MTLPDKSPSKQVPFNILLSEVVHVATEPYIGMLTESESDERLSAEALNGVKRQIEDLRRLEAFLAGFDLTGMRHSIKDRDHRTQIDERGAVDTFTVRYANANEGIPHISEGRVQEQLSLQGIRSAANETELEAVNALSLQGKSAERTLSRFNIEDRPHQIIVNTISVARGFDGRVVVAPHAGVRLSWRPEMPEAIVNGVKYVGKAPHYMPFEHIGVSGKRFSFLFNAIERLSTGTIRRTKPA